MTTPVRETSTQRYLARKNAQPQPQSQGDRRPPSVSEGENKLGFVGNVPLPSCPPAPHSTTGTSPVSSLTRPDFHPPGPPRLPSSTSLHHRLLVPAVQAPRRRRPALLSRAPPPPPGGAARPRLRPPLGVLARPAGSAPHGRGRRGPEARSCCAAHLRCAAAP